MINTSFGELDILLKKGKRAEVEFLRFTKEGRAHKHSEFESFFVLRGSGKVFVEEKEFSVKEGSLVTIRPIESHYMIPDEGVILEGLLWYHSSEVEKHN